LKLPGDWRLDLADIPGSDPDSRTIRLTTDKDVLLDDEKQLVGYLGRAHPLVRHAIDRVRHTALGDGKGLTDSRAAVVQADVKEPAVYCTYLARVNSAAGREFERVVAVRITANLEPQFCPDANEWLALATVDSAVSPVDVWKNRFATWATNQLAPARRVAADSFAAAGLKFIEETTAGLAREKADLDQWLGERVRELVPSIREETADLFAPNTATTPRPRPTTPAEQLAAIRDDDKQPSKLRSQGDALLKLHRKRADHLARREQFTAPEVVPLGLLMVIPREDRHGA
jgi:hypothetical protein